MKKIVFATNNENKLREIKELLKDKIEVVSLEDIGFHEDIEETELTLEGNALLKSKAIFDRYDCDVFSDDTGLEIDALDGEPGVFSARYADKNNSDAEENMKKVLAKMKGKKDRTANFRTAISLILNGEQYIFEGIVHGTILKQKQGDEGFGYDPIFQPLNYTESFAELPSEVKNKISHRGLAVQKLVTFLEQQFVNS